jgi:hypothetical protein
MRFARTYREATGERVQSWQFADERKPDWPIALILACMAVMTWSLING